MQIKITGKGIKLSAGIETYINKKLGGLGKFFKDVVKAEVVVGTGTKHRVKSSDKFYAECKLEVPGNDVFQIQTATTLYEAIDSLKDHLEMELKKYKTKLRSGKKEAQRSTRNSKEYQVE